MRRSTFRPHCKQITENRFIVLLSEALSSPLVRSLPQQETPLRQEFGKREEYGCAVMATILPVQCWMARALLGKGQESRRLRNQRLEISAEGRQRPSASFDVLDMFAEFETNLRRECQLELINQQPMM
jgi:hypothetical protein